MSTGPRWNCRLCHEGLLGQLHSVTLQACPPSPHTRNDCEGQGSELVSAHSPEMEAGRCAPG